MKVGNAALSRIQELCKENNVTINKMCTISGITQSTLSSMMARDKPDPCISTIKKICDGFNITLVDFFSSSIFDNLEQEIE